MIRGKSRTSYIIRGVQYKMNMQGPPPHRSDLIKLPSQLCLAFPRVEGTEGDVTEGPSVPVRGPPLEAAPRC